jgi:hypothetical protein
MTVPLFDDGSYNDGAMEPDGIYNNRLIDITRVEGTYHFRAVATYGEGCRATREAHWPIHVEPGIDPDRPDVSVADVTDRPEGRHGTLVIVPRDKYDNPLGRGRPDLFEVTPLPGVQVIDPVKDGSDGSYGVSVTWGPNITSGPGVFVHHPDRNPVPATPTAPSAPSKPSQDCTDLASGLLQCLGLNDPEVKRVRVKSVCLEVRSQGAKLRKDGLPGSDDRPRSGSKWK